MGRAISVLVLTAILVLAATSVGGGPAACAGVGEQTVASGLSNEAAFKVRATPAQGKTATNVFGRQSGTPPGRVGAVVVETAE